MPQHVGHDQEQESLLDALRASEDRLRLAVHFSYGWEYWEGTDGQFVFVSPSCEGITGYSAQEFLQEPDLFMRIVHPDDCAAVNRHREDERQRQHTHSLSYRIVTRAGQVRWVDHVCEPVYDSAGTWLGWRGSNRDITELHKAREELEQRVQERTAELRESELRFRQLAENIDEVFCLWEPASGRVLYLSPAYEVLWGRPAEEAYDRPAVVLEAVHPADREQVRVLWEDLSRNHDQEFRVVRPDGSMRWVRGRTFAVEHEEGAPPRIAAIAGDITSQKEVQAARSRADRIGITGQLAASLAHEFNNPLQAAIGCLDLALEAMDRGQDPKRFMEILCQALERAATVVHQLRSLHAGFRVEDRCRADLGELLHGALAASQKRLLDQGVEVVLHVDPDLPSLHLHCDAMQQVFLNMALNALDAMAYGGELRIEAVPSHEPEGVWIRFADTGMHLPAEVLEHLLEPFPSAKAEGLGLGLAISQNIVEQHGGRLEAETREGMGTVFALWLPA
jgi:PAS domain S-box-containing protein